MAIINTHLSTGLRVIDNDERTVHSYHNIRPGIDASQVEMFLQGVNMLRGQSGGNAFLTLTTEMLEVMDA